MKSWTKNLLLILVTLSTLNPTLLWGAAEDVGMPPAKRSRLMIPGKEAVEDIADIRKYAELTGIQQSRLEGEESGFARSHLRFVESVDALAVGYGLLPEDGAAIPELKLAEDTYQELREMGVAVKVLLGYLKGENDLTPDGTNVLVPHVSCVVQIADKDPELRPLGFLREAPDEPAIVLLSANQGNGYKKDITRFFNQVYRGDEALPTIKVIDAEDVGDAYIPIVLKDWVARGGVEPFTVRYMAEPVVNGQIMSKYPCVKDVNPDRQRNQNTIYFTARCLQFLLQEKWGEILRINYNTVSQLHKAPPVVPAKENADAFKAFVRENKNQLIKAALRRIRDEAGHLDETKKAELEGVVEYVEVCTFPGEQLNTQEQRAAFWRLIKRLNMLTCNNPDGGRQIAIAERLLKKFSGRDYQCSKEGHTEQLLVKLLRSNPGMLVQGLEAADPSEDAQFLGFVIDSFSWLDVCRDCSGFLNSNPIWTKTLEEAQPLIEEKRFTAPVVPIDSVFRFVSQHEYGGGPLDLGRAGGGADYSASGWDFRFLSKKRVSLGTRFGWRDLSARDRVIERIQSRLMSSALSQPFHFWLGNSWLLEIALKQKGAREFFLNVIRAIQVRHADQKVFRLGLAVLEESRRLELLQSVVENPDDWGEEEKNLLKPFYSSNREPYPLAKWPQKYAAAYYGGAVLERAKKHLDEEQYAECKEQLCRFGRYCLVYNEGEVPVELSFNAAIDCIIQYWQEYWRSGDKYDSWHTPEEVDRPNMDKAIGMLWGLAYREKYIGSLSDEERTHLKEKLAPLNKPEWVKALLRDQEAAASDEEDDGKVDEAA